MAQHIGDLPHALADGDEINEGLARRLAGKTPAVFLDYDGTLTPIVDRPENAVISESMRDAIRGLAEREEGAGFADLLDEVQEHLHREMDPIEGALVEPKKTSVAAHYRLVAKEEERLKVREVVERILAEHPGELKVTPGKMVYEIQPKLDWDKGKAVVYLLEALDLNREDVVPIYVGDDITDEEAFEALKGRGVGVFVGRADDPELSGRTTAADYVLHTTQEVERFLVTLAR